METNRLNMLHIIRIALAIGVVTKICIELGSKLSLKLPTLSESLNRKPFNCRPCLTFWLTLLSNSILSVVIMNKTALISSVIIAFIVFAIVKYQDNKLIEK